MSTYIRKNNTTHEQKEMPMCYPADRVYLDGDTDKNVQDFADDIRCDKTTAGTYQLRATVDAQGNVTYSWVSA